MNYTYEKVDITDPSELKCAEHYIKIGTAYWVCGENCFYSYEGHLAKPYATKLGLEIYIRVPVVPKRYRLEIPDKNAYRIWDGDKVVTEGVNNSLCAGLGNGSFTITKGWADAE